MTGKRIPDPLAFDTSMRLVALALVSGQTLPDDLVCLTTPNEPPTQLDFVNIIHTQARIAAAAIRAKVGDDDNAARVVLDQLGEVIRNGTGL